MERCVLMMVKVTVEFLVEEQTPHLAKHLVKEMLEGEEMMATNYRVLPLTEIVSL